MHSEHLGITMLHRRDLLVGLGAVTVIAAKPDLLFVEATSSQDPGFYGWSSDRPAPVTASFYVSPEGKDASAGTFARPFRTIQAGIDHLARSGAGSLAIRGGLYRESLRLGNLAGKKTAPILIHRYGDERVRVTAADVLSGWRACSDEDVKDLGISAAGLFVCNLALADLQHGSAFALNLHEDGLWSSIATERANMTDLESASDDNRFFTAEVPLHDAGRLLGFRDSRLKGLSAGLMKDVRVLVYHAPNFVSATSIAAFSGDTGTVMLANQKLKVQKENRQPVVRYALQNIATGLGPGRWMSRIHQDGNSLAVMLYMRFPLSLRNVEDLLHERGVEISHETVRYWWNRFGPLFASEIRRKRAQGMRQVSRWRWHLDEMYVKINGATHYLWRAVDHESEILESFVTKTRDRKAALKFLKKAMRRYGRPVEIVTDRLRSYGAALKDLGRGDDREMGRWVNNRAENSHLPFRRRKRTMLRFRRMRSLQKFASVHASIHNHFNQERALYSRINFKANRAAALAEWRCLLAA